MCDPVVWLTLSGTHTQRPISWRGWKTRPWIKLLFGTISNPSMAERGAAEWIASLPVSPVSRGRQPESKAAPATSGGSGPSLRESSETRNLSWSSSKTCPALFQEVDFISYSTTLPKAGSMRSGYISAQETWEPVISESVSSSSPAEDSGGCWATPNARDHKGVDLPSRNGGTGLSHQAQTGEFSHRDRAPTGAPFLNTCSRRLNPAFVCWLMGWPWWWTRAERISFAAEEMALWRSRARQLLSNLYGD